MKIKDKIWLTSKTRMNSEVRLKRYDSYANTLIILYSFTLICISISRLIDDNAYIDNLNQVILSLGVFSLSIMIYYADFRGKAAAFRECYLRLDRISDTEKNEEELIKGYHEILLSYPNHDDMDFYKLVIGNPLDKGNEISDSNGQTIKPAWLKKIGHWLKSVFVHIVFTILLCFPLYLLFDLVR